MNHHSERDKGGGVDELAQKLVERRNAATREADRKRAEKMEDTVFHPLSRQERLSISTMLEDQLGRHGFITEKGLDPFGGPGAIYSYTKGETPVRIVAMHNICDVNVAIIMPIFRDAGDDFEVTPGIIRREGEAPSLYSKSTVQLKNRDDARDRVPEILELYRMGEVRFSEGGDVNEQAGAAEEREKAWQDQRKIARVRRAEANVQKERVREQIYLKGQLGKAEYHMHRVRNVIAAIGLVTGPLVFSGVRIDEMVMSGREKPEEHIVDGEVYPNIRTAPPETPQYIEETDGVIGQDSQNNQSNRGSQSEQEKHSKAIDIIDTIDAAIKALALAAIGFGIGTAMYQMPIRTLRKMVRESKMEDKNGDRCDDDNEGV